MVTQSEKKHTGVPVLRRGAGRVGIFEATAAGPTVGASTRSKMQGIKNARSFSGNRANGIRKCEIIPRPKYRLFRYCRFLFLRCWPQVRRSHSQPRRMCNQARSQTSRIPESAYIAAMISWHVKFVFRRSLQYMRGNGSVV